MNENVAVYFRCSTDKQDNSIADQRTILSDYAKQNGLTITTWFDKDEGKSGTSFEKRPDFMRMVRLVESGRHDFSQILVYDVDRWGRPTDPDESGYWEFRFKRCGVAVRYVSDETVNDNSMMGRIGKKFKQELASEESRKQSIRVRERSKMRAAEGFRVGGFAPYGYKRLLVSSDGTPIRVLEHGERKAEKSQRVTPTPGDDCEIEVVRRIFALRESGKGARFIANTLNQDGIPAPGASRPYFQNRPGKWSQSTVASIIKNPIYIGCYTYNKQVRGSWARLDDSSQTIRRESDWIVCPDSHEGIIAEDLFQKVQGLLYNRDRKRTTGRGVSSDYLLSGMIVCKECGYNFHGHRKNNGFGKTYRYYDDSGYRTHGDSVCKQTSVPADGLEQFLLTKLDQKIPQMINPIRLKKLIKCKLSQSIEFRPDKLKDLRGLIECSDTKLENLTTALEAGGDFDSILKRMSNLRREKVKLEAELKQLTTKIKPALDIDKAVEEISRLSNSAFSKLHSKHPGRVKSVIGDFLDRVEIDRKSKIATFFIHKIPNVSKTYEDTMSVKTCRRSGFNPDFNKELIVTTQLRL